MKFCPNCRSQAQDNANFCIDCGETFPLRTANNSNNTSYQQPINNSYRQPVNNPHQQLTSIYRHPTSGELIDRRAPGRNFLLVTSIIGLSALFIGLIFGNLLLSGDGDMYAVGNEVYEIKNSPFLTAFSVLISIFAIFVYIMGIVFCKNLNKGDLLWILSKILIICYIFLAVLHVFVNGFSAFGWLAFFVYMCEIILPVIYRVGAGKNESAYLYIYKNANKSPDSSTALERLAANSDNKYIENNNAASE
jgi:hypothetical protein